MHNCNKSFLGIIDRDCFQNIFFFTFSKFGEKPQLFLLFQAKNQLNMSSVTNRKRLREIITLIAPE